MPVSAVVDSEGPSILQEKVRGETMNVDHHQYDAQWRMYSAILLLDTLTDGKPRSGLLDPMRQSTLYGQNGHGPLQRLLVF